MGTTFVIIILFLAFINLPLVRSVTCTWAGAVESEGACFLYNSTYLSYSDAESACHSIGGVLAKVVSQTQLDGITTLDELFATWIGANDKVDEGTWVWEVDGSVATELNTVWDEGNPHNDPSLNCATAYATHISDMDCAKRWRFLCMEKELTTTPVPVTSTSTTSDPSSTNTAASTTDTSASTTTASSTNDTGAINNTAASTTDTSASTTTASSTNDTGATNNTAASTTDTSATTLVISRPLTSNSPINILMKCGASHIRFNILLLLHLCWSIYLVI